MSAYLQPTVVRKIRVLIVCPKPSWRVGKAPRWRKELCKQGRGFYVGELVVKKKKKGGGGVVGVCGGKEEGGELCDAKEGGRDFLEAQE